MTISNRVFDKMREMHMSQKEFSEKTGIPQSTISEWKIRKTNPASDKIMIICQALGVSPEWLLSGTDTAGNRGKKNDYLVTDRNSEIGYIIETYNELDYDRKKRLIGYMEALSDIEGKK